MSVFYYRLSTGGLSFIALSYALATIAYGQETPKTTMLETIVVTGERVSRSLSDTASSVRVFSTAEIIKAVQNRTVKEMLSNIANVHAPDAIGAGTIRGQAMEGPNTRAAAFYGGTVPRATNNVDGRYLSFNELSFGDSSIWDVETMEVFRGPQTASQGANSIAGAIIVNTKDPTFKPEAAFQATLSSNKGRRISVAASGPIVTDELAGRIALDFYHRDSVLKFVSPVYSPGQADPNISLGNGRVKLLWQPSELPGLEAKLTYNRVNTNGPQSESAAYPFVGFNSNATSPVGWDSTTDTGLFDISYAMENGITLFNQTQYSYTDVDRHINPASNGAATIDQDDFSNETRATFEALEGDLTGVAGLFFRRTKSDEFLYFFGGVDFVDTRESLGAYTEMTYRFDDRWSLTGGLRYQHDELTRTGHFVKTPVAYNGEFDALLPKLSLSYEFTPDFTVGGLINRGYNPGGVSLDTDRRRFVPFEEETVWNYELFTRAGFLDGDLTVTGNLFYTDIYGAQRYSRRYISALDLTTVLTLNAERAHSYGLEVGADWALTDTFRLNGSLGLLKTEISKFTSTIAKFEGNSFAKSPSYTLSLGFKWDFHENWNLGANIRHVDKYFSDDDNASLFVVNSYTLADANIAYMPTDKIRVFGFVKNITDERAATSIGGVAGRLSATFVQPRTFGLGLRMEF